MDTCKATLSDAHRLTEQIACQLFEVLPERGPVMVILDRQGNCWPSSSEQFARLNVDETLLAELRAKVDDGAEPVITQAGEMQLALGQLATDRTNCGYVLLAIPQCSPESIRINTDLVEVLLGQIGLAARLIERDTAPASSHASRCGLTALSWN